MKKTQIKIEKIQDLLNEGKSPLQVSKKLKMGVQSVYYYIGQYKLAYIKKAKILDREAIVNFLKAGNSVKQTAEKFNCSIYSIYPILRQENVVRHVVFS
jgi:DNA invertase Pin-like site-specific DNA recombinase